MLYGFRGQIAICFWIAASRFPGLGWSLKNCGPAEPSVASFLKKSANSLRVIARLVQNYCSHRISLCLVGTRIFQH